MNILFPVSECVPFAKTGGLADVAGALPQSLKKMGHHVHLVMPLYSHVKKTAIELKATSLQLRVPLGEDIITATVVDTRVGNDGPVVHCIQYDPFFDRPDLYQNEGKDYEDNDKRFTFFARAVMELGKQLELTWDIIHCHDWHTGLIPVYLRTLYRQEHAYQRAYSLFTIHNLAYQGVFDEASFKFSQLPESLFHSEGVEFWGKLNFMKAGIMFADKINTVSQTYAKEIQQAEYGCGLNGVLQHRKADLSGIINGIDYDIWNPETDPHLPVKFAYGQWEKKHLMKTMLLDEMRLFVKDHTPVVGMITRLDDQKGLDILAKVIEKVMNLDIQFILLGTGAKKYHDLFWKIKAKYSSKIAVNLTFDNALAHRIYAGCDMFLMPSRYEPCGLGQLISLRYATIPIVRRTGGLADTIIDFNGQEGTGFSFEPYHGEALLALLKFANQFYQDRIAWKRLMKNAMEENFSWDHSAEDYVLLYKQMVDKPQDPAIPWG